MALNIQKPSHAGPRTQGDEVDLDKRSGAFRISIPTPACEAVIIKWRAASPAARALFH